MPGNLPANARPYNLRHSFASLLLHEGRSVIYVARQLGDLAFFTRRDLSEDEGAAFLAAVES